MKMYLLNNQFVTFVLYIDEKVNISIDDLRLLIEPYIFINKIDKLPDKKNLSIVVSNEVNNIYKKDDTIYTNYEDLVSFKRLINDLCNRVIEWKKGVFFHSSSVEIEGGSYIFIGDRGSGKTTTMLNLLSENLANYSSNERTAVIVSSGEIFTYGNVSNINIRANTLKNNVELFNKLDCIIDKEKYDLYVNKNLSDSCCEKLVVSYNDLKKYLKVNICPINRLKGIILIKNEKDIVFELVETKFNSFRQYLNDNIISGVYESRRFLEDMIKCDEIPSVDILNRDDVKFYILYKDNTIDFSKKLIKRLKNDKCN